MASKLGPGRIDESEGGLLKQILLELRVLNDQVAQQSGSTDTSALRADIAAQLGITDPEI